RQTLERLRKERPSDWAIDFALADFLSEEVSWRRFEWRDRAPTDREREDVVGLCEEGLDLTSGARLHDEKRVHLEARLRTDVVFSMFVLALSQINTREDRVAPLCERIDDALKRLERAHDPFPFPTEISWRITGLNVRRWVLTGRRDKARLDTALASARR